MVEEAALFEIGDKRLAAFEAVHARIFRAGKLVHRAVAIHDVDFLEVVALADEEVVGVVRRRNLHDAGAELLFHVVIADDRYLAAGERQNDCLADERHVAFVLGVDGYGGIAGQCLRARRRHHHVVLVGFAFDAEGAAHDGIAHIPEVRVALFMLHLVIRESRAAARAPVHDVVALVDEPFVVKLREDFRHGARASFVERETLPLPVGGIAEHTLLVHNRAAILLLPLPDPLHERLAPKILTALAFLPQRLFDHVLRGDAGMVGAGKPKRVETAHPAPAHEDVLNGLVERVAHVQDAGHVRRRNDNRIRLALAGLRVKIPVLLPDGIPFRLCCFSVVMLFHCISFAFFETSLGLSRLFRPWRQPAVVQEVFHYHAQLRIEISFDDPPQVVRVVEEEGL